MITIELDRLREIRFTYNALVSAQKERGLGILAMLDDNNDGPETVRALLWAGLIHEDKSLTPEKVGDLMDLYIKSGKDPAEIPKSIFKALDEHGAFKSPEDADIKNPT
ncbi:MAG: hypothetical protein M0Q91_07725 [Methanoregula sp.]|jgi:hypothetical protein|nr:hypothetical protein [Methanoregula sp.]